MKLKAVVHPAQEGGYWAEVPGFRGCVSCGDTLEETRANIREAFEGVFDVMQEMVEPDPEFQTCEDRMETLDVLRPCPASGGPTSTNLLGLA